MFGVKNAFKVSERSNIAQTVGGWVGKYSEKSGTDKASNEIDLLDMEGLSRCITKFNKRLFLCRLCHSKCCCME